MITAKNIRKQYGDLEVLKGINLTIKKGEIVSIIGTSGAGKTTLLQILGTLDKMAPSSDSSLVINDVKTEQLSEKELAKFRNDHIG
ncbi:ATP-binding cassette domain-containing protein, partial [Kordia sp.]|uniref:ATP-binding cassette domain-containing protein n=1 Tax=Kordia sp. TaxID=1965332 RepID=UPI003D6BA990